MISSEFTGYKISGSFVLFFPVKKVFLCKSNYIQLFLNYELNRSASYGEAVCILTNFENESFAFENAQKLEFLLNTGDLFYSGLLDSSYLNKPYANLHNKFKKITLFHVITFQIQSV